MKQKVVICLNALVERLGTRAPSFKDIERLLAGILQYLNEGALEIRTEVKRGLLLMRSGFARGSAESEFLRILGRTASESDYKKVRGFLDKESGSSSRAFAGAGSRVKRSAESGLYEETKSIIGDDLASTGASVFNAFKKPSFQSNNIAEKLVSQESIEMYERIIS